jgi:hypothetical protein
VDESIKAFNRGIASGRMYALVYCQHMVRLNPEISGSELLYWMAQDMLNRIGSLDLDATIVERLQQEILEILKEVGVHDAKGDD